MSTFELTVVVLNLLIAAIYAAILWVMVQQRRIMDEQLKAMQSQLREAERTRMAAHRPILVAEPLVAPESLELPAVTPPSVQFFEIRNIGNGAAMDAMVIAHELEVGAVFFESRLPPYGALGAKESTIAHVPATTLFRCALTLIYSDIFGNRFWTLYDIQHQQHTWGEGTPTHLARGEKA